MTARDGIRRASAKTDGARSPTAATAMAQGSESDDEDPLDVDVMVATMKQAARQLDELLQRVCEQNDVEDKCSDETSVLQVAETLADGRTVSCEAYFEAIRSSFVRGNDARGHCVPHTTLRTLTESRGDELQQKLDEKTFKMSVVDMTFMFPVPRLALVEDDVGTDDEWEMVPAIALDAFQQRITQCLEQTDHAIPSKVATSIARGLAEALVHVTTAEYELSAIHRLFPVSSVETTSNVEWRHGNRVCKVQVAEKQKRCHWGIEVVLTVETVARAQALSISIETGTASLGPALSCAVECSCFVPKSAYKSKTLEPVSVELKLTVLPHAAGEHSEDASTVDLEENTAPLADTDVMAQLPEFLNVYQWGGHATLSPSSELSPTNPSSFGSAGFQRLEFHAPFPRNRVIQAACGRRHSLLLNDMGMVFSYGHAMDGALGLGDALRPTELFVAQPRLVNFFFENAIPIQSIACGGDDLTGFHSAAVSNDGCVYTWGVGIALGLGSVTSKSVPERVTFPQVSAETTSEPSMAAVACGSGFCVALDTNGLAYAWGKWSDGRLGLGAIPILTKSSRQHGNRRQLQRFQLYPKALTASGSSATKWRKISCGDAHCVALTRDGQAYVWGRGRQGQLGLGAVRDALAPVVLLSNKTWRDVAAGDDWSMAVDVHGSVWSWGACGASVLGLSNGDDADRSATVAEVLLQKHFQLRQQTPEGSPVPRFHWLRPQPIPSLSHTDAAIRSISAGARHAAAVSERGNLYVWGSPQQGLSPQPTLVLSNGTHSGIGSTITETVFCGGSQVIALTSGSFLARAMQQLYRTIDTRNDETVDGYGELRDNDQRVSIAADVVLIVAGGKALFAHKLVLSRRSPVLRDLILNEERPVDAVETTTATPTVTEVLLPQLRVEIARIVLEFLYTDNLTKSLDPLSYLIRDVLRAARAYQIPRLVQICRERIASASYVPLGTLLADLEAEADEPEDDDDGDEDEDVRHKRHSLNHDLAFAFGDATWSDVRIVAENRAILVHRSMLIARSEYFRALLAFYDQQHDARATPMELVVDESYLGMLRVVNFIYNDELTTVRNRRLTEPMDGTTDTHDNRQDEQTEQLLEDLIAADKYGLVRMKRLCEHHITVTPSNCLDVLVVADLVHADHLKQVAMTFVHTNLHMLSEPVSTPTGSVVERLAREFPHLMSELYDRIHRHMQQQTLLKDWQRQVETEVRAQQEKQTLQWQQTQAATHFPWVPLILACVFATLYLSIMNARESDYALVPAINLVVVGGLLAAAFMGTI